MRTVLDLATQDPNWAEIVLAVTTAIGAIGLLATIIVAAFAGRQVREARHGRQDQMGAELLRRWTEAELVECRRLVASFGSAEELKAAFHRYRETNAPELYVLYREPDYFEQVGALERMGAIRFELIQLLGPSLPDRYDRWKPALDTLPGGNPYPMFAALARKMRAAGGGS
jgi:hypothetical protein